MLRCFALIVLTALLSAASCRNDERDEIRLAPIQVTFTVPADSALLEANAVRSISIDFQREISSTAEVELRLFPPPQSSGVVRLTAGGRNVTWFTVTPKLDSTRQHLLIDGPNFLRPYVIRWYTGTPHIAEFQGEVISNSLDRLPQECIVFALDPFGGFDHLDPVSFETAIILAASPPFRTDTPELRAGYRFGSLPTGAAYVVVAVLDTSGDGVYSPRDDWWGYFRGSNPSVPEQVVAQPLNPDDPPRADVDITLRAPVSN